MRKLGFIVSLLAVLLLAACGEKNNAKEEGSAEEVVASSSETEEQPVETIEEEVAFPRTVEHVMGELVLENAPEKVASVDIMGTDYLLVLDIAPVVSEGYEGTRSKSPIFAKYAEGKTVVDLGGKTNRETLLEMDPEVIVMTSSGKGDRFEEFNKLALTVVVDFSLDAAGRLMKFAEVVGKEEKAKEVIAEFEKLKEEAKQAVANHKGEKVLFLVSNGKDFTVMHPKNFPIYFEEVGLEPVEGLPEDGKIGGRIGIEALSEFNADHIFIAENRRQMKVEEPDQLIHIWMDHPVWKNLKAVKEDQVYVVDTLVGDTFFLGEMAGLEAIKTNLGN